MGNKGHMTTSSRKEYHVLAYVFQAIICFRKSYQYFLEKTEIVQSTALMAGSFSNT